MAEQAYAVYTPDTAKMVLEVVRYLQAQGWVPLDGQRTKRRASHGDPIFVRNDSDEEIPSYACLQATGTVEEGGVNYITVDKPADVTGDAGAFIFNGPSAIEKDGYGMAYDGPIVRALSDGSDVVAGEGWSPVVDEWAITTGGTLVRAIGADDIGTDVIRVATIGGAGVSLFGFVLNEEWVDGTADASIYSYDGPNKTDTGIDANVYDPERWAVVLSTGDAGMCILDRGKYYTIQARCPG